MAITYLYYLKKRKASLFVLLILLSGSLIAQNKALPNIQYPTYKGLIMTGYQGWFNTPNDDAGKGWTHYSKHGTFVPDSTTIDFWPDVNELQKTYATPFKHKDGTEARVFSSYDPSTVDTHFSWMQQYCIDGAFLQRFVVSIKSKIGKNHCDVVLQSAIQASQKYARALCLMYDLSGMKKGDEKLLLEDITQINDKFQITNGGLPTYLHHNGKPMVAVWGIGFNDHREYGLTEAEMIIDGLRKKGFSIMIGVPTHWRTLTGDSQPDVNLHALIAKCDVILPWLVGRYDTKSYPKFKEVMTKDMEWCRKNQLDYAPLVFPGFSWKNMYGSHTRSISREKGNFYWSQIAGAISIGASMLYVAMFDEIDEGTAIFKCLNQKNVPLNGKGEFQGINDELQTDHYLWLTQQAKDMLTRKSTLSMQQPKRAQKF